MPEGDTIHRAATTMGRALKDRVVTGFRSTLPRLSGVDVIGHTIRKVEARGKNLLIHFDDGRALYTHLRMEGSWHIYKTGDKWQKPERQARVVIETDEYVAVCFNAPTVELLSERTLQRHPLLQTLGSDILTDSFDIDAVLAAARERPELPIGVTLMRQHVVAGIGNVYKSEVLFLCKTDPFARTDSLTVSEVRQIIGKARELMLQNLDGKPRTTRHALDGGRFWVYGRAGKSCYRCGTIIQMRRQGDDGRSTYWCPNCQQKEPPGYNGAIGIKQGPT